RPSTPPLFPYTTLFRSLRITPLASLVMELLRLVDDDLAVGDVDEDLGALERARGRTFEVDAGLVVAAAVAGALELVLRREPVGRDRKSTRLNSSHVSIS